MKLLFLLFGLLIAAWVVVPLAAQTPAVTAEAIGQANLRAFPSTEADLLGQIAAGTRYPVVGRSEFFPWLLLGDPASTQPIGWVFAELVSVQGEINTVPFSTLDLSGAALALPAPEPALAIPTQPLPPAEPNEEPAAPVLASTAVGIVRGEINLRYGPGVDYPRIGIGRAGDRFPILMTHTQLPWVQVAYPSSPTGAAWVAVELLEIEGDLSALPSTNQLTFALPTLTPTPSVIQQASVIGAAVAPASPEFAALGEQLWQMVLDAGFEPGTSRVGALFLMHVESSEAIAFGEEIAFSGMSLTKIPIMAAYFGAMTAPPRDRQPYIIAEAMVCSENISSNAMLTQLGGGNPYAGAEVVSAMLERFGLRRTFIYTPFANDPFITPQAPRTRVTDADQVSARPDPYNQFTVTEMGSFLYGIVQCAAEGAGPLIENFDGAFTPLKCQQMLNVMNHNRVGTLLEVGVPEEIPIAHKHGWINDTHGDAAIVFTPGGTYIFVVALHGPTWLEFATSAPLIEEMSRIVYNHFNPDAPLAEVRMPEGIGDLETCNRNLLGSQLIADLESASYQFAPLFGDF